MMLWHEKAGARYRARLRPRGLCGSGVSSCAYSPEPSLYPLPVPQPVPPPVPVVVLALTLALQSLFSAFNSLGNIYTALVEARLMLMLRLGGDHA